MDVFVVASGTSDGHVAMNGPGADLASRTRQVALAESTRRDTMGTFAAFASLDDVPEHGVTVGLATLADARELAVVVHGEGKRQSAARLLAGDRFRGDWPVTFAHEHPRAVLWADRAAVPVQVGVGR